MQQRLHALKTDVGVQDKKLWAVACECVSKSVEMLDPVEPERRLEDELHVESVEVCSASSSDALDALADLLRSILRGIDLPCERLAAIRQRVYSDMAIETGLVVRIQKPQRRWRQSAPAPDP